MKYLIWIILLLIVTIACRNNKNSIPDGDVYYTCSMDPQVIESKPGKCPICKMPLTRVKKSQTEKENELKLSDQQIQLGNIITDTLKEKQLQEETILNAKVEIDKNLTTVISSRAMGRIDRLYIKKTGEFVGKGQPLFRIYSEEINIAVKELLLAIEMKKNILTGGFEVGQLIEGARKKLEQFGLTRAQITQIETSKVFTHEIDFLSPVSGIITTVNVQEGNYVMSGADIYHLADFSSVWIEAQIYQSDLQNINVNGEALITFPSFPGKKFAGRVAFVNPELNTPGIINIVRVELKNPGNELVPGMPAYVTLLGKQISVRALPTDAIIKDSRGSTVWIKTGTNTFKNIMVETGIETGGYTEIKNGLTKGEVVVVSGAYLLNSEFVMKKGANPMEGHNMHDMQ